MSEIGFRSLLHSLPYFAAFERYPNEVTNLIALGICKTIDIMSIGRNDSV